MPIVGQGWELHVERLGLHRRGRLARTYGRYSVVVDGVPKPELRGFMVEAPGPGDNDTPGSGRCIAPGRYRLSTHFGRFVSADYSMNISVAGDDPMPAVRLLDTGRRTGILVHPAYPPQDKLYVASVGCLNPTAALEEAQSVDFWDSRARMIALLDALEGFAPTAFQARVATPVTGAAVIIDGA